MTITRQFDKHALATAFEKAAELLAEAAEAARQGEWGTADEARLDVIWMLEELGA
jgi:hypothetical protein